MALFIFSASMKFHEIENDQSGGGKGAKGGEKAYISYKKNKERYKENSY